MVNVGDWGESALQEEVPQAEELFRSRLMIEESKLQPHGVKLGHQLGSSGIERG